MALVAKIVPPGGEVIDKMGALATAAFGLVAALAWNGLIQDVFTRLFGEQGGLWAKLFYALIVTVIAVAATYWIGSLAKRKSEEAEA